MTFLLVMEPFHLTLPGRLPVKITGAEGQE